MAVPTLARAFAFGVLVATATPAAQEPQIATCGGDDECEEGALLQSNMHMRRPPVEEADAKVTCDPKFKTYPYREAILWGSNYPGWEKCDGKEQSPINLVRPELCSGDIERGGPLDVNYGRAQEGPTLINNGHALDFEANWGSLKLTHDDTIWQAGSFHFHTPSEHSVDSKRAVAEMHIVNLPAAGLSSKADVGSFASVVGILFDVGRENDCLKQAFRKLTRAGCSRALKNFNLGKCFKKQLAGNYWFYQGSLTTPPCTEGVNWHVMKKRATISRAQLKLLEATYINNARPLQFLNDRKLGFHKVV